MMFVGAAGAGTAEKKQDATVINAAMIAAGVGQGIMTGVVLVNHGYPGQCVMIHALPGVTFR